MGVSCQETGSVTGLGPENRVFVTVKRSEACRSCSAHGACTALGGQTKDLVLTVENTIGAEPGDQVSISLSEASVVKASFVLYLIPAVGLIAGALTGRLFAPELGWSDDPASIAGSAAGLAGGLLITRMLGKRMSRSGRYMPKLVAIIGRPPTD